MILTLLAACFTPEADITGVTTVPFENPFTQHENLVLQPFTYDGLLCPDGNAANFYAVYQTDLTDPAPIVIVFHSGAFDYVEKNAAGDVLDPADAAATHYAGENRMSAEWASNKVFETLGILKGDGESSEVNAGALPAALADKGAFAIYPADCWADLGRNESGSTTSQSDWDGGVERNGRFLNWAISAIASADATTATTWKDNLGMSDLTVPLDSSGVYLIGLGEGGRAISELAGRNVPNQTVTPILGMIIDSTMDNLQPIVTNNAQFKDINDGLARIFPDANDDDNDGIVQGDLSGNQRDDIVANMIQNSLWSKYFRSVGVPLGVWYSSADPLVPTTTLDGILSLEGTAGHESLKSFDVGTQTHVQTNADIDTAHTAVEFILP